MEMKKVRFVVVLEDDKHKGEYSKRKKGHTQRQWQLGVS